MEEILQLTKKTTLRCVKNFLLRKVQNRKTAEFYSHEYFIFYSSLHGYLHPSLKCTECHVSKCILHVGLHAGPKICLAKVANAS